MEGSCRDCGNTRGEPADVDGIGLVRSISISHLSLGIGSPALRTAADDRASILSGARTNIRYAGSEANHLERH